MNTTIAKTARAIPSHKLPNININTEKETINNVNTNLNINLNHSPYLTSLIESEISKSTLVGATNITKLYKLANITLIIERTALSV